MVRIGIPAQLRSHENDQSELDVDASTVRVALEALCDRFPDIRGRIFDEDGQLRRHVNVWAGEKDIRFLQGLDTSLSGIERVSIRPQTYGC